MFGIRQNSRSARSNLAFRTIFKCQDYNPLRQHPLVRLNLSQTVPSLAARRPSDSHRLAIPVPQTGHTGTSDWPYRYHSHCRYSSRCSSHCRYSSRYSSRYSTHPGRCQHPQPGRYQHPQPGRYQHSRAVTTPYPVPPPHTMATTPTPYPRYHPPPRPPPTTRVAPPTRTTGTLTGRLELPVLAESVLTLAVVSGMVLHFGHWQHG